MACRGFDFDFVDEPAKDLYCKICSCLIKQATMLNCGHVLCKDCLDRYVESSKQRNVKLQCPLRCNKEILPFVPVPLVDQLISSLTINCEKKNVGCEWKGELSNVQDHLKKTCGFREVSCENCGAHIFNKDLQDHIADCPIVICLKKCGEKTRDEETKETRSKITQATSPQPTTKPKPTTTPKQKLLAKQRSVHKVAMSPNITPEIQNHLDQLSRQGFTYIHELLHNKNTSLSTFELLLTHNPDIIDMRSDYKTTIIHCAAYFNRADVLALLLSVDPSHIDDVNDYKNTALMSTVYENHIECVRVLLDNNADVSIKNCGGYTPLSWASKKNYADIIRLLEEH